MAILHLLQTYLIGSISLWCGIFCLDITQKYFSDVSINCTESLFRSTSDDIEENRHIVNSVWLLPNGEIVRIDQYSDSLSRANASAINESSVLYVEKIDDIDFGIYWCIQAWNDSSINANKHTINIHGPPMHEFYEQQKNNAIIGAISAGIVLGIVLIAYIVWYFRCSEKMRRKRRLTDDLAKGVNRYSTQIYDNVGMDLYAKKSDK